MCRCAKQLHLVALLVHWSMFDALVLQRVSVCAPTVLVPLEPPALNMGLSGVRSVMQGGKETSVKVI